MDQEELFGGKNRIQKISWDWPFKLVNSFLYYCALMRDLLQCLNCTVGTGTYSRSGNKCFIIRLGRYRRALTSSTGSWMRLKWLTRRVIFKQSILSLKVVVACTIVMFCPCLFCPSDNVETCLALPTRCCALVWALSYWYLFCGQRRWDNRDRKSVV